MLIKRLYKPDLTKTKIIEDKKNVLSFNTVDTPEYLQITEFGFKFIWLLFKHKVLKRRRIFLCLTPVSRGIMVDFFSKK